ncbi:hypothetical protein NL676_030815 [Syzygium grande]|nr:hypothetical protein NL676_030815 [Syzygium grande]
MFLSSYYATTSDHSGSLCGPVVDDVKLLSEGYDARVDDNDEDEDGGSGDDDDDGDAGELCEFGFVRIGQFGIDRV